MNQADAAPTVLVTGATRGIGLEFVKQYAAKGWHVIATARSPEAGPLAEVAASHTNVRIERMDVTDTASVDSLAGKLKGVPIDLLLNNAGQTPDPKDIPRQVFGHLDFTDADRFLHVNATAPIEVTEAFYANVKASRLKKVVAISSLVGLHGRLYSGAPGIYFYKMAKAALNAGMANIAAEVRQDGVIVLLISPGAVRVEKSRDLHYAGQIEPDVSIRGMIKVIDEATMADTGTIRRFDGESLPF